MATIKEIQSNALPISLFTRVSEDTLVGEISTVKESFWQLFEDSKNDFGITIEGERLLVTFVLEGRGQGTRRNELNLKVVPNLTISKDEIKNFRGYTSWHKQPITKLVLFND